MYAGRAKELSKAQADAEKEAQKDGDQGGESKLAS
jgi:hypothetical protein